MARKASVTECSDIACKIHAKRATRGDLNPKPCTPNTNVPAQVPDSAHEYNMRCPKKVIMRLQELL